MILRLYAMWNQSKRILYILLFIYVPQVIVSFVYNGFYTNTYLLGMSQAKLQAKLESHTYVAPCLLPPVMVVQVIDFSFCSISFRNAPSLTAHRFVLSVILIILAATSTLKESIVMYKATKQWQPNQYMQLFMKDGILYFLVYVSPFPFLQFSLPHTLL